jgi:hypothetical protein
VFHRIQVTRNLLRAWDWVGGYLNRPGRRLTRAADAAKLVRQLQAISDLVERFPPLLGEVGQPGFWVVTLGRREMIVPIFRALGPGERETLARDWRDGRTLLAAHRRFLAREWRALRRHGRWARLRRATQAAFDEHPGLWLVCAVLALVGAAHAFAFWLTHRP